MQMKHLKVIHMSKKTFIVRINVVFILSVYMYPPLRLNRLILNLVDKEELVIFSDTIQHLISIKKCSEVTTHIY